MSVAAGTTQVDDEPKIVTGPAKNEKWIPSKEAAERLLESLWVPPVACNELQRSFPPIQDGESGGHVDTLARMLGSRESQTYGRDLQALAGEVDDEPRVPFGWADWVDFLPEMAIGDVGPTVGALQRFLKEFGYKPSEYNHFDVPTEFAVKAYQSDHGLEPTGRVDRAFWSHAMFEEAPELS